MPLTDVKCRNAKGKTSPYKLSDGGGLHLLVNADGARYWRLAYRWHGKQRTLALGVYPAVGLTEARAARDDAKRNLAADVDPSVVKRERKRAADIAIGNTFEAVAREWHENWKGGRTPYYAGQILRRLEADIFPAIGRRPIAELEPPELLDMLRKVEKRGVNETARRLKQLVGQIFRFAIVTGRAKRDPSSDLKDALRAAGEPQRHRAMPMLELPTFLKRLETYGGEQQTKLALKLVTLTFLRTTELRAGRWNELENLDQNSAQWRVPAERMKMRLEHLVPLSRQAVAVLHKLRALAGNSPNIFPSPGKEGCMSSNTMLYALYRMGYHGRATTHGFRAVASTILNESNLFNRDWIERQLAHVERNEVRRAYNAAEWMPDRRRMMQWWADHLTSIAGGNVIPLSQAS
ncbi:integrase arm-type DNA-binding domain-containing protein [Bradyrhizobium septentrionale]|uniref:Integrase arm-type DNA-binding domain-containing protein n=1 Tax=Bradyrhizobium septentrionale TaxID=1404411 RepID=A0A973W677_9BRAD|nr:integrase arm-type DNA-binding domain-containing protein [Bradyrhizobium septentrionale]UGY16739.1 integrase arm-type DNA-binding domain-containing protein [Bradyrhizobium septentrionale]